MKIAFHTLGCKVNQYESEAMAEGFRNDGHEIVDERDFADVYIINTCTVTAVADRKSRQYIRRMKKVNPESIIAVTGCYAQISPEDVAEVEGVDIIAGTNEKSKLADYIYEFAEDKIRQQHILEYDELTDYDETGIITSAEGRTRAYIKVQEGCNRFCAYCVIPYARGKVRSRSLESIVEEAKALIEAGYKEIVLTGINTALYEGGIHRVIEAISEIDADFRIRLSSLEPAVIDAEYVKKILKYDKLCHHLHLSAQSGSNEILGKMNRPYNRQDYIDIVNAVREADECYGISTDIIVGFPGEKEADFRDSCALVDEVAFVKTHAFKYSRRPKTAAARMTNQVNPQIKNKRSDALQQAGDEGSKKFFDMCKGKTRRVLIEELDETGRYLRGYTDNYVRTYIEADGLDIDDYINEFCDIILVEPFRDGMNGRFA